MLKWKWSWSLVSRGEFCPDPSSCTKSSILSLLVTCLICFLSLAICISISNCELASLRFTLDFELPFSAGVCSEASRQSSSNMVAIPFSFAGSYFLFFSSSCAVCFLVSALWYWKLFSRELMKLLVIYLIVLLWGESLSPIKPPPPTEVLLF